MIGPAFKELWSYRELLFTLAGRDIKVRYKQTIFGIAWAVAQPLAMVAVFTLLFKHVAKFTLDPGYPDSLVMFCGMVPWLFTQQALNAGLMSLVSNMNLVTKIFFPREILPFSVLGVATLDMALGWGVYLVLMASYGVSLPVTASWAPLIFLVHIILVMSVSLTAAMLNVFYRDIRYLVTTGLYLAMFVSPVVYPLDKVADTSWYWLYMLNPIAGVLGSYRQALLYGTFDGALLLYPAAFAVVAGALSYWGFKRVEPRFAEVI